MVIYMKKNAFIFVSISFLRVTFFTLLPLLGSGENNQIWSIENNQI